MYDTHCHLTGDRYPEGIDVVLARARSAGLKGMIAVAIDVEDARSAAALAGEATDVWCTAGIHPSEAGRAHDVDALAELARGPRCVAWGEMGLDGHWGDPPMELQREVLDAQLSLISQVDHEGGGPRPIILHSRRAVRDVLDMLADHGIDGTRCVFHCFTEGPDVVDQVLAIGASVSFTGVVTYRNAADVALASDRVPLTHLMVETDSPYLAPEPVRGTWPNEPAHVVHIADFLAARRGLQRSEFDHQVNATVEAFFKLR